MKIIFNMCSHFPIAGLALILSACHCHAQLSISTSTPTPCYGEVVTLVCHHPEVASNPGKYFSYEPTWRENSVGISPIRGTMFQANSDVASTHTNLTINITADYFRNNSFNYSCLLVLAENGQPNGVETSEEVNVDPVDQPGPPEVSTTTTGSNITLTWNTTLHCFESEMFTFVVIWNGIGSGTSTNVTTSSSPYTISGLQPGTSYQISVQGVGGLGVVGGIRVLTLQTPTESPIEGDNLAPAVVIPAVVVCVVGFLIGVVLAILILVACRWRTRVYEVLIRRCSAQDRPVSNSPEKNVNYSEISSVGVEAAQLVEDKPPSVPPKKETNPMALCEAVKTPLAMDTRPPVHQVQYTPISVEKNRPVPNPPEEKVNYSEISSVGVKAAQLVEGKPPPVPPKKETNPMEEQFQTDVIEALTEIGMTLHSRELDFFTATYQSMKFLGVSQVESEEDITPADVEKVVRVKTKMAASRAVLICNQDTMGSDQLINLQQDLCYFIKAGGYGTEKWKTRLIFNFKETVGDWMKEQNPGPHLPEDDKGLLHSEKVEGGVGPPEKESGLSQPVEETGVAGQYAEQESTERMPPMTLVTRLESHDLSKEKSPLSNSEFADDFVEEKYKNTAPMMGIARGDLDENYNTSHCSDVNPGLESNQPPAEPFRSQPHGDSDHIQTGPVVGSFTSTFEYPMEDDDTVPLIEWECV